ncbi:MAG: sulfur carrier protein ThiS [Desulfobacteraceae bacterium]
MEIQLNGTVVNSSAADLMELVTEQGLDPGCVVVEHNHGVIKQEAWEKTPVCNGDIVELLSFVGGG